MLESMYEGLMLPLLVYICTMIIALNYYGYLRSCFVVVGGKDVRKPARIPFSMVCRAGDYMDVCKSLMCSTIVSVSTMEFSGCYFVVCVSIVHSLLDYLVPCRIILPCENRYSFFLSNSAFHLGSQSFPIDRRDSNAGYLN